MKFNPTTWRTIPYSSTFLTDSRQLLVSYSLQFLLVVLCYPLPKDGAQMYEGHIPDGETGPVNQFAHYFRKLHRANDFNFMVEGMSRVLHQPLSVSSTYLPGSQTPVRFHPEMLLLFWESLQQNKRFRSFLVETDRALDFLVVLLFYALEHKTNPAQIGLVRMCVFILQPLSSEAKFAKSLNKVFEGQASLPTSVRIPSFSGTYADFLIISIYSLIATSKGQLVSLYSALFMTLSNIAPYIRNISVVASSKLIQLFSSISQPSFLFANDSNFRLLQYILEVINSIIEHNFNDNPHLIYAILRSHERFEALQDLTLMSGVQTVNEIRKSKAKKAAAKRTEILRNKDHAHDKSGSSVEHIQGSMPDEVTTVSESSHLNDDTNESSISALDNNKFSDTVTTSDYKSSVITQVPHSRKPSMSSDLDFPPPSPQIMSEKARGKLPEGVVLNRQNSSSSIKSAHSVLQQFPSGDENFDPSEAWFETWFPNLDMSAITTVLNSMAGEVTRLTQETPDPRPIIKFLQTAKLEGVTPQTPNPRTFVWSEQAKVWFESLLFGYIYLSETQIGNGAVGVWTGTNVKLFRVQNDPNASDPGSLFRIGQIGHGVDAVATQLANKFNTVTL
ncbi:Putative uncharacterized protein [Taphrina deformans PYCC 5710]|uniref:High-temperature-induced dauer-formation protein n=1 Tax=Taphrina deformans (strain PYCC 5710 / ATCC 11124 / CBS 356.35 / IMI 108563 / JCM 9778 / NBRC 8474) TaxID=1097556 RepID=R4XHG8_TAPDE|nr:Putative uncharacterized protein [Taphrina deformans PYCC 5710]|eukprot:CCG85129.1 Putative uncharacterized protein [Taphrina deformans PYCC 5710]